MLLDIKYAYEPSVPSEARAYPSFYSIGHYRNVRGLGKSMVVFRLFEKLRYSNERSTIYLESLPRIEVFGGGKWQNGSSTNITRNREFVWIG